ncbi:MAG: M23 family metallopeptidase [Clostridia bacterium]|nr:M23 family metallopeptidase [Clostridia bacterium]
MQKKDAKAIGSRLMAFMKKNIHYILMILCVIAIGVVVTVVAVLNTQNTDIDVVKPDNPSINVPDDNTPPVVEKKFALVMPVVGGIKGREFSDTKLSYNKTLNRYDAHLGVDITGQDGSEVLAGFEGTVLSVTNDAYNGGVVTIDYGKGYIATIKLLKDVTVKKGDKVKETTVIGKIGKFQFECKEEPHIHMELQQDKKMVDPMIYVVGEDK